MTDDEEFLDWWYGLGTEDYYLTGETLARKTWLEKGRRDQIEIDRLNRLVTLETERAQKAAAQHFQALLRIGVIK